MIGWEYLKNEKNENYFNKIKNKISLGNFEPKINDIFNFIKYVDFEKIKVVIIGQDPYPNGSNGLAFSTFKKIPYSLRTIIKGIKNDYPEIKFNLIHGDLRGWAQQGILLMNSILTYSKTNKIEEWEVFTNKIVELINFNLKNIIFLLWGNKAKNKLKLIDKNKHFVIENVHPSHYTAKEFIKNGDFLKTNKYLESIGKPTIDWFKMNYDIRKQIKNLEKIEEWFF